MGASKTGDPFSGSSDPFSAGNGSLMRLAPVAMYYSPDLESVIHYCGLSSRTTHGAAECIDACRYFGTLLHAGRARLARPRVGRAWGIAPALGRARAIAQGDGGVGRRSARIRLRARARTAAVRTSCAHAHGSER